MTKDEIILPQVGEMESLVIYADLLKLFQLKHGTEEFLALFGDHLKQHYNSVHEIWYDQVMQMVLLNVGIHKTKKPEQSLITLGFELGSLTIFKSIFDKHVYRIFEEIKEFEKDEILAELIDHLERLNENLTNKMNRVFEGQDFSAFIVDEYDRNLQVQMGIQDYKRMVSVIENYNKILGRRKILTFVTEDVFMEE